MDDSRRRGLCKGILFACVYTSIFTSVRASPLYAYGVDAGDSSMNIGIHQELKIPHPIHFYGQEFNDSIYISEDGLVSPDHNANFRPVNWRKGTPNLGIDLPFIAPFHYDGFVPSQSERYSGKIYYRLVRRGQFTDTFLNDLDSYLSNASVRIKTFRSEFAIIVTWENVTGNNYCHEPFTDCPSNTFQLAIVVSGNTTFAIFNYYKMEIPFNDNQLAGMNGGYGRGWTDVFPCVGSCLKDVKDRFNALARNRGSDIDGRYIHYVSDDVIVRGGCLSPVTTASLSVYPREAGMFGGEMLSVSGECMSAGTPIYCRFGEDNRQISSGVMETSMRGRCPVPLLTTRGQVKVEVGRSRSSFQFFTNITIIYPDRLTPIVDTSDIFDDWFKMTVSRLTIRWPSEKFSTKSFATVSIKLIGYREDGKTNLIEWRPLVNLSSRTLNSDGQFSFNPSDFRCRSSCDAFEIGIVMVALDDEYVDMETQYQTFTMGPLALGWYVNTAMNETIGADWPSVKCREWDNKDKVDVSWLDRLLSCPCTLTQALADWGRWQPDVGCSMFSGSKCTYHIGAKHCVRSVNPSPDGSGNQCCYEQDGLLRYAADTFQGSTPDRSHDWGAVPYGKVGYVPSLSHWLQDVITFYYCCLWNEYRECKTYMDRRPTKDCRHYVPPQAATAYGDPHITTFDGTSYYFGGSGDFWLLKSDLINIQGQFQEQKNEVLFINSTQMKPTALNQVVMGSGESDTITITLAPTNGSRRLEVKVNTQRQFFEKPSLMWQDFQGVSVVNNAPTAVNPEDQAHSNFTILFRNGAGVQVVVKKGLLHLMVVLPPINEKSVPTRGLLGTWDNNTSNDYTTSSGQTVNIHANEIEIYQAFALTWAVNESESLFQFPKATERQKLPLFGDPKNFIYKAGQTPPTQDTVNRLCGSSSSCVRDFYVTNDADVAGASNYMNVTFATLKNSQKIVYSCGLLDIPMAQKSNHNYSVGSVVSVTGCRPQNSPVLSNGPVTYTCVQSHSNYPQWSPVPDSSLCGYGGMQKGKKSNTGMIIGIVIGCVCVLIICIILAVVFHRRRNKQNSEAETVPAKRPVTGTDVILEPGTTKSLIKQTDRTKVTKSEVERRSQEV